MKNLRILSVLCVLAILVTIPASVFAAQEETLPDPGITPDSPLYFADKWGEQLAIMFTFRAADRVSKALKYAEERLAEMQTMEEKNKFYYMEQAADEYGNYLEKASGSMVKATASGFDTSELVAETMSRHISWSYAGANAADSRQVRLMTREMAENCQEEAIEVLALQNPDAALKLNFRLMEQQYARLMAGQADNGEVVEALEQYERLGAMNQKMLAYAVQQGTATETRQMIQQGTASQEGNLYQVRNRLTITNNATADSPLQTSHQEQWRANSDNTTGQPPVQPGSDNGTGYGQPGAGAGPGLQNKWESNGEAGRGSNK